MTYTAKPNVYACFAAKALHVPIISNVTGFGSVIQMHGLKRNMITMLFRKAFRAADYIMFQNEENMRFALTHGFVKSGYQLIPGSGVSLVRFPLLDYPEGGDGTDGDPVVFNYIGRIFKEKGIDDYLEVAKRIKVKYPNTEFNLIGFIEPTESYYYDRIAELEAQGIIIYRGQQNDVIPWIKRAHIIIHPSMYGEGISNVLLENASCGRPIITTDNPGCIDCINNGVSGFFYRSGEMESLVELTEHFLKIPNKKRRKMGIEGRRKVEKEFDRNFVIQAYLKTIHELLK